MATSYVPNYKSFKVNANGQITPTNELDLRERAETGEKLQDLIHESVAHTQAYVQTELPNVLHLTHKQFVSIAPEDLVEQHTGKLWHTIYNVMDINVDVSDRQLMFEVEVVAGD